MAGPRSLCEPNGEARPMKDTSQFATAMLALVFTGALLVTGQLFIEQRAQRDMITPPAICCGHCDLCGKMI